MEPKVARETTYVERIIPGPPQPPRQVIVERIPAPQRPRDLIYEVTCHLKSLKELTSFLNY